MNILVTGGSSGLGRAIVEKFASEAGNIIYFTYNRHKDLADAVVARYANTRSVHCDFTDANSVDNLIGLLPDFNIDVLVNNAYIGNPQGEHFHKTSQEEFLSSFEANVLPVISITQGVISGMRKRRNGRIITILTSSLV